MVRISKKGERRSRSPKAPKRAGPRTGTLKDNLPAGFRVHHNALPQEWQQYGFVGQLAIT